MFIDRQGPAIPATSAHKKQGGTSQDEIKAFKKRNGYINLDNPEHKKRYQNAIGDKPANDCRPLHCVKTRKAAVEKAEAEHLAALARLADGSAVHRQVNDRTQLVKTVKKAKVAKVAKKLAKPKALKKTKAENKEVSNQMLAWRLAAHNRRKKMGAALKAGEYIKIIDFDKKNRAGYQSQFTDLQEVAASENLSIIRLRSIREGFSLVKVDNLIRYQSPVKISGSLFESDKAKLLEAITSGHMVLASDLEKSKPVCSRSMTKLARKYGFNLFTVTKGKSLIGWVLLEEAKPKWWADWLLVALFMHLFSQLSDMCQALDYKKCQAPVDARMPTATPDEILEAAYREFKRVAKDTGSTVSEVLAVKDRQ